MQRVSCITGDMMAESGKIVDLGAYRRKLERAGVKLYRPEREPAAVEPEPTAPSEEQMRDEKRRRRRERHAWFWDICASLSVIAVTAAFTLEILFS